MTFQTTSKNLKHLRSEHGLTQSELSVLLGLKSSQFISNIERGRAGIPPEFVIPLSRKLGISKTEMVRWAVLDFEQNYVKRIKNNNHNHNHKKNNK